MNLIRKLLSKATPDPVPFPEMNFTYTKPEGMTDEQCGSLPCFRGDSFTVSCWRLTPRDRLRVLFRGKLWLMLMMNGHPPVCITPESPFATKTEVKAPAKSATSPFLWAACVALVLFAVAAVIFALKLDIRLP